MGCRPREGRELVTLEIGCAAQEIARCVNAKIERLEQSRWATVFAHACQLGAEGIVSKKIDGAYRSGPCRVWIKVRNPASIAVQRERSEIWNR
jgi:hypothetical protein